MWMTMILLACAAFRRPARIATKPSVPTTREPERADVADVRAA